MPDDGAAALVAEDIPHVASALAYAEAVVDGEIPAGKWVRLACERQLKDLHRAARNDPDFPYYFDSDSAEHNCRFIERMRHVKGPKAKARETIRLEPWQCFIQTTVFGWKRIDDDTRRFRTVYEELARKNAKSTKVAANGLYMMVADGEEGADVFAAATKRDQAKIVFGDAAQMARKNPSFRQHFGVNIFASSLRAPQLNAKFEPLDSEGKTQDGLNPHLAILDELHAHKNRLMFDVVMSALGARDQQLVWMITTAGFDRAGVCYEQRGYVCRILEGKVADDSYFGIIYTIDDDDDPFDPACWAKANPNLGVSVSEAAIARDAARAKVNAAERANFLTKRLCVWTKADTSWMDMQRWDACARPGLKLADFAGRDCWLGLDLASTKDISAVQALFETGETLTFIPQFWLPELAVARSTNAQYDGWVREGWLQTTPGEVTDYDAIVEAILEIHRMCNIVELAFDPYQSPAVINRLMAAGVDCIKYGPTVLNFSEPMKQFEARVAAGTLEHDGNPAMTWMVGNVVCHVDAKENIFPRKDRPEEKIDGPVAALSAFGRWLARPEAATSFWETMAAGTAA